MRRTVIGTLRKDIDVDEVVRTLQSGGFDEDDIEVLNQGQGADTRDLARTSDRTATGAAYDRDRSVTGESEGIGHKIANFFRSLTGSDDAERRDAVTNNDAVSGRSVSSGTVGSGSTTYGLDYADDERYYGDALRQGNVVVMVHADDEADAEHAIDVLHRYGAESVNETDDGDESRQANELDSQTAPGRAAYSSPRNAQDPAYLAGSSSATSERPSAFSDSTSYRESADQRNDRQRAVTRGGVRVYTHGTDQPLEQDAAAGAREDYDSDFRNNFQTTYGTSGGRYDDYLPAYNYGAQMANDQRYRGRSYDEVESDLRSDYEGNYGDSGWERFKNAIRYGWDRATGKLGRGAGR